MRTTILSFLAFLSFASFAQASENCRNGAAAYALKQQVLLDYVDGVQVENQGFKTKTYYVHSVISETASAPNTEVYYAIIHFRSLDQKTGSVGPIGSEVFKVTMADTGAATCRALEVKIHKVFKTN